MTTSNAPTDPEILSLLEMAGASSYYLVDLARFDHNLTRFLDSFRARYESTEIGYSYKTNYLPCLIRAAAARGARTEVVSGMELEYADLLGQVSATTLLNGPVKRLSDMKRVFSAGGIVVLDSVSEIDDAVEAAAVALDGQPARVALRCQLPKSTPGTRFGIDLRSQAGHDAIRRIDDSPSLRIVGLHAHHSGDRGSHRYRQRISELITVHLECLSGRELEFIDVGGGFGSPLPAELADQIGGDNPSFDDYAEAVTSPLIEAYGADGPILIAEPGMGLLADTTTFVTKVMRTKRGTDADIAVVDGSLFNVKPLRSQINLPGRVVASGRSSREATWRFVGHTCMEIDVLRDRHFGSVAEGDLLVIPNLGAYTTVLNAPFISPLPPIVAWGGDMSNVQVVRPQHGANFLAHTFGVTA